MESLGVSLKRAREERNLSISQAAEATRIGARHLQSIEEARYRDLPGGMYNRAFIRSYAEFLGLDPKPLLDRYAAESTSLAEKTPRVKIPMPAEPREFRLHPALVWMLMLALSVLGVYSSREWISSIFAPFVPRSNPVQVAPAASKPSVTPASAEKQPPPAETTLPEGPPVPEPRASLPVPSATTSPSGPVPSENPAPAAGILLQLDADQLCWASFTVDGETVFARNLEPGERQSFQASSSIFLVLGNAGAIRATINGKPARPFGKTGAVVRALISQATLGDYLELSAGRNP